jgi:hypothetical protein
MYHLEGPPWCTSPEEGLHMNKKKFKFFNSEQILVASSRKLLVLRQAQNACPYFMCAMCLKYSSQLNE